MEITTEAAALPDAGTKPDWREELLAAMTAGVPLRKACEADGMPSHMTVYRAAAKDGEFADRLSKARIQLASTQQDDLDELYAQAIACDDSERVQALRLAGDILKFKLVKVLPKLYGDRPETQVNVQNFVGVVSDEKERAALVAQYEELLLANRAVGKIEQPAQLP